LKLGATVILDPQWPTAASVAATVAAQRPTVLFSVPSLYPQHAARRLAPGIAQAGVACASRRASAARHAGAKAGTKQTGLWIANGYGASEPLILVMLSRGQRNGPVTLAGCGDPATERCGRKPAHTHLHSRTAVALGYSTGAGPGRSLSRRAFCRADLFRRDAAGIWHFAGAEDSL